MVEGCFWRHINWVSHVNAGRMDLAVECDQFPIEQTPLPLSGRDETFRRCSEEAIILP